MVRARKKAHLEELLRRTGDSIPVVEQYGSDYAYRIFLSRPRWTEIVARFAIDINYSNFKNEAHKQAGNDYCTALHRIWSTMYALQTPSPERYIFDQDFDQSRNYVDDPEDYDALKNAAWDEYDRWESQLSRNQGEEK